MALLNHLSIRDKTFLLPSLGFLFLISVILLSFNSFEEFTFNLKELKGVDQKTFQVSKSIEKNVLNAHIFLLNSVITKNKNLTDLKRAQEYIKLALKDINNLYEMNKHLSDKELNDILNHLKIRVEMFYEIGSSILGEFSEGYEYGLDALYGLNDINVMMYKEVDKLILFAEKKFNNSTSKLNVSVNSSRNTIMIIGIVGVIISFLFSFILIRNINSPLYKLKNALFDFVNYLEKKDSNLENIGYKKLQVSGSDEISKLTKSFNKMVSSIEFLYNEQKFFNKKITDSINYASLIQNSILPHNDCIKKCLMDYFIIWEPKDKVGGDMYQFEEFEKGKVLAVIDCTGHGIPGAFMTMVVKAVLNNIVNSQNCDNPALILKELNQRVRSLLNQDKTHTLSDAGLDGGILYFSNDNQKVTFAGAKTPLFYIQNSDLKVIKGDRESIGYKKSNPDFEFKNHNIEIDNDTYIYLTTDGLIDQNGGKKSFPYGKKRFQKLILQNYRENFSLQKEAILNSLLEYQSDEERNDDITIFGFKLVKKV